MNVSDADEPNAELPPLPHESGLEAQLESEEATGDEFETDELDDFDDDFSLDTLSRAYAEVIRKQQADAGGAPEADPSGESPSGNTSVATARGRNAGFDLRPEADPEDSDPNDSTSDDQGCPITPESIIESMLFVGARQGDSLTASGIAAVLRDVTPEQVMGAIDALNEGYVQQASAYRIVEEEDVLEMQLVEELTAVADNFYGRNQEFRLSQTVIDVLSVVAYHQPVTREELDKTRGKPSNAAITQLVRRGLVEVEHSTSRPVRRTYHTSARFLELFRLESIEDLPQSHDVSEFEEYID